ncbi:probable L-type lectin-domain containing receptor kinase S.5 [Ipomoea triloba]|uniref:probable L-type lectin-domain containing receptor kinase S.5 n=1 Tax=Ipomoea triloba TaxID=35885 RepID=UPI00125D17D8|nr:probable L-type lectin-domain containing receptor kinase S.5 [Ipomoea triloba]
MRAKLSAAVTAVVFLCIFQFQSLSQAEKLKTFRFEYGNFNQSFYNILDVKNATISNGALQITPDTAQEESYMLNTSGRIFFSKSFRLWDSSDVKTRVASFNSSFLLNIFPQKGFAAEGVTFLISPTKDAPPANSYGEYLGLTNATTDGNSRNQIVAVEFDTFKQDYDPDGNHVGLDINGVRSKMVESLGPHGIILAPISTIAIYYNIWVCYDGVAKVIEVYMAEQKRNDPTPPRPFSPVLRSEINLREHLNQESYFGFSASTGIKFQLNCVLRWNFTIEYFPQKKGSLWVIAVAMAMAVAVVVGSIIGGVWVLWRKRRVRSKSAILGALQSLPGTARGFEFKDLKKATNKFDEKNKLGEGGYGVVYKGVLAGEELEIAVKIFSRDSIKQEDDFLAELTIINRLRHKHLVKLLGWCHNKHGKLLLVYEYLPNGSLDKHLFSKSGGVPLSWNLRYKIASGVASALHYLHNEYEQTVVHRDLKPSNIMLDSNFNARLGDFGLARALDNERSSYSETAGVMGTVGYIAPECFHTGKATPQSDVYAFGAVLLEIVCGKRAGAKIGGFEYLVDWVWHLHRDGRILDAVDGTLGDEYAVEEAERLLLLGLACSHPTANQRPQTSAIVQMMLGFLPVPHVPPFKPSFVWSSMVPTSIDSSLTETSSFTTSLNSSAVYTQ